MRFASLGSGSKGNATLIESDDTCLMVDCGFSVRETERRLARLGKQACDIDAILVTHEHSDHWKGVLPLARKFNLRVFLTAGCHRHCAVDGVDITIIDSHNDFRLGAIQVTPVAVPHDAREPVQFVFESRGLSLGVLTDLGSLTAHVERCYANCDALVLEANHDLEMLRAGPYPFPLQQRVSGQWGHLSNQQAASLLAKVDLYRLRRLVIGHISEKNNSLKNVRAAIEGVVGDAATPCYATQQTGFGWLSLI